MLLNSSCHICRVDSPIVQIGEVFDMGEHIAAVVRGRSNGVPSQIDQPQLLELPQVHDIVKSRDVVAACTQAHSGSYFICAHLCFYDHMSLLQDWAQGRTSCR